MSMAPDEICRRLGEAKVKEIFLSLHTQSMKRVLEGAGLSAVRLPSHSSTRKRNEDWANRLWRASGSPRPCIALLYEWLTTQRNSMLAAFLDAAGVPHQKGVTEADFMKESGADVLLAAARELLEKGAFDRREIAVYLLLLDSQTKDSKLAPLREELERHLPAPAAA